MKNIIKRYVENCHVCLRAKSSRQRPNGLLQPNEIPDERWLHIAADFITGLPESMGYNAILTVICLLSKQRHYIPCRADDEGTSAEEMAWMFIREVFKHHGLPKTIISDRGPQFISTLWQSLCKQLGIDARPSTAHHPQTDGQTERANQDVERSLRTYVNYMQDDWAKYLPMVEFADNDSLSESTGFTPFYLNNGHHPRMAFSPDDTVYSSTRQRLQAGAANDIADHMKQLVDVAKTNLAKSKERMKEQADRHRNDINFQVGDYVMLDRRDIDTQRPCRKLDDKRIGPYKILEKIGVDYRLDLPVTMRHHTVFHPSKLTKHPNPQLPPLPGQINPPPPPVVVAGKHEWELDDILDSRYNYHRLQYRCKWSGIDQDLTWYNADGEEFQNAKELVDAYHARYPTRPGPQLTDAEPRKEGATGRKGRQRRRQSDI